MSTLVTFASMIMTDGKNTTIGVYRGRLCGRPGARYINFNSHTTVQLDVIHCASGNHIENVHRLAAEYAAPDAPAVDWNL
jgi:hypothetical protein